jgi:hypothetical protein
MVLARPDPGNPSIITPPGSLGGNWLEIILTAPRSSVAKA